MTTGAVWRSARTGSREQAPGHHHRPWSIAIHQPAFEGREPGIHENQDRERNLDGGSVPVVGIVYRIDEQRPAILQIGQHDGGKRCEGELEPAVSHQGTEPL